MKNTFAALARVSCAAVLCSSCFLLKKAPQTPPPATTPKPPATETQPAPPPPSGKNPYQVPAFGKEVKTPVVRVALLAPLYIDQVTGDTAFSVTSRTPLPPQALGGLEFYEGALLALDSLREDGIPLQLQVYDTKSASKPLGRILSSGQLDSATFLVGAVSADELREVSAFAKKHEINFVSATYPNDGGVTANPFLTILNSTLQQHCRAIQDFVQQKFTDKRIIVIYQDNTQEKQNLHYLQEAYQRMNNSRKAPLTPFAWDNQTTTDKLLPLLSKDQNNVVIITALYPQVAESIIGQLVTLTKDYQIQVVGMPTLDGDANLRKPDYAGLSIYYSTPYPYAVASDNPSINAMMWDFFRKYRSRPSDMALKGYESLFYFGSLAHQRGKYFNAYLSRTPATLLTRFAIQPIYLTGTETESGRPDYFENTRLYFMQIRDGKVMPAN